MTTTAENDPILRIGSLKAATSRPKRVNPCTPLKKAMQIMTKKNYSQLPVVEDDGSVRRAISWKSIGEWIADGNEFNKATPVEGCTQAAKVVPVCEPLLDVCWHIAEHDFVLVCDGNQKITGIVTAADLSGEFMKLTEAFLLIGQIERNLRKLIKGVPTPSKWDSKPAGWEPGLREYCEFLAKDKYWNKLGLNVDKVEFINALERVRTIRGDTMHFKMPETSPERIAELKNSSDRLTKLVASRSI